MSQESSVFLPQLLYLGPQTQYSICSCRGYRNIPKNIKCKHPPEGDLGQIYLGKNVLNFTLKWLVMCLIMIELEMLDPLKLA